MESASQRRLQRFYSLELGGILYLSFYVPLAHLRHSGFLLGTRVQLPQRHIVPRYLALAAAPSARPLGAAYSIDTAHLSRTHRLDVNDTSFHDLQPLVNPSLSFQSRMDGNQKVTTRGFSPVTGEPVILVRILTRAVGSTDLQLLCIFMQPCKRSPKEPSPLPSSRFKFQKFHYEGGHCSSGKAEY